MKRSQKSVRGQAVVESVLGLIVFISIFLFGVHFAEVTFTQMKVTEAAQAALWDSTAGQMHALPNIVPFTQDFSIVRSRVNEAVLDVNTRYQDFDGRGTATSPVPRQVLATARPFSMRVSCSVGGVMRQSGVVFPLTLLQGAAYTDNGGIRCTSEAIIDPFGAMKIGSFLEKSNGFFQAKQQNSITGTDGYRACGVGRPAGLNGPCNGEFGGLIDDWGMAQLENDACLMLPFGILPCTNRRWWTSVMGMYQISSGLNFTQTNRDLALVSLVNRPPFWSWVGIPLLPGSPTSFYMAGAGEETLFIGFYPAGDGASWFWWTTPAGVVFPTHTAAWGLRRSNGGCYLGKTCRRSTIWVP